MKKIIAALLTVIMIMSLSACFFIPREDLPDEVIDDCVETDDIVINTDNPETDQGSKTITFPPGYYNNWFWDSTEQQCLDSMYELMGLTKQEGIESFTINDDESITLVLTKDAYAEAMKKLLKTTDDNMLLDLSIVVDKSVSKDFSEITVTIKTDTFSSTKPEAFYETASFIADTYLNYQVWTGAKEDVTVTLIDSKTDKVLFSEDYSYDDFAAKRYDLYLFYLGLENRD